MAWARRSALCVTGGAQPAGVRQAAMLYITPDTWADQFESLERINSICQMKGSLDSCNSCKRLGYRIWFTWMSWMSLHELSFVSRIELSVLTFDFSARVSVVCMYVHAAGQGRRRQSDQCIHLRDCASSNEEQLGASGRAQLYDFQRISRPHLWTVYAFCVEDISLVSCFWLSDTSNANYMFFCTGAAAANVGR